MCGIAGIFGNGSARPAIVQAMTDALAHRGPDDQGAWIDAGAGIALGHRRLSIIDLSPAGHEPMVSASGRLVVTYNGEVYNHAQLRSELERRGQAPSGGWRGHSDIETLLEAIDHWGLEAALDQAAGMFAFALWDREARVLRLVRDRFGEKPLYWGWAGRDLVFASELKAIRAHPEFDAAVNEEALALFASRLVVPAPHSIYRSIFKLEPGCILTVDGDGASCRLDRSPAPDGAGSGLRIARWYDYLAVVRAGLADPIRDRTDAVDAVEQALANSVGRQRLADVPVGMFLSGGIDSSAIASTYQALSPTPIRSFSIGVEDPLLNEADDARAIAADLGTVHHDMIVTAKEALDVVPLLPAIYDEPFADSSQIPTYLVSRFARSEVTVALTGDGGDEFFGGYNRHRLVPRLWHGLGAVPGAVRSVGGGVMGLVSPALWDRIGRIAGQRSPDFGAKVQRAWRIGARSKRLDDLLDFFLDEWSLSPSPVAGAAPRDALKLGLGSKVPAATRIMAHDALSYLPDDILTKVDRASMAVGLESRAPFLDPGLVAIAARIPIGFNLIGGKGKCVLRDLVERRIHPGLIDRPKSGFAVPLAQWLRGPLKDWAEELISQRALEDSGFFDVARVRARWTDLLQGRNAPAQSLWAILMAQGWLQDQSR